MLELLGRTHATYLLCMKFDMSSTMITLGGTGAMCKQDAYFCRSWLVEKYLNSYHSQGMPAQDRNAPTVTGLVL